MALNNGNIGWQLIVVVATLAATSIAVKTSFEKTASSAEKKESNNQKAETVQADGTPQSAPDTNSEPKQGVKAMAVSSKSQTTGGSVIHANVKDFEEKALEVEGRVLVDFHADWCGPCRMLAPVLEELARDEPRARIVKVDVDKNAKLAAQYRIQSIPSLIVFENGKPVDQQVGVPSEKQLRKMLDL